MYGGCYGGWVGGPQIPNYFTPQIPNPKILTPQIPNPKLFYPSNPKSQTFLPLKSQIPNFALNITKLLSLRNNYQHFMAFYMIPYNNDDKLNIYVYLKIISTIITQHFFTFITPNVKLLLYFVCVCDMIPLI